MKGDINIMAYEYLKEFIYNNLSEAEDNISEEKPHYFVKADSEMENDIKRMEEKLNIKIPLELKTFFVNVGSGELFAGSPDEYIGQYIFLDLQSILGIYDKEEDIDCLYSSRRELAREYLINNHLLAFVDFSELSFLFISLDEDQGKNAVYYSIDTKIASSLEEFVEKIMNEPDYFIEEM